MKVFLAPGATGGLQSIEPYVNGLAARGVEAHPVQLPGGNAERAVPAYLRQSGAGPEVVIGGRSYGGRVASLAAAGAEHEFAGLLLFAYPLHRPGFPEQLRTEHWPRVRCPVLIVQGESDPFGSPDELRREAGKLQEVRVVTLPGTGHGLKERLHDALAVAADWISALR
ncbi:MAG TPA: alpha/beta family hydrolase [Candidatus Dormibacteraeota bacterium]|nr:alpha/beta family hydrolase [Candidatus Dormibacteraeota bacterium]